MHKTRESIDQQQAAEREQKRPILHVNDIKLEGDDRFTKQFNLCSEYWQKSHDESLSEDERKKSLDLWFEERQRLELGIY